MSDRVVTEIDGGVAHVRLNRPEKLNALDLAMFTGIADTGTRLAGDRSVRAVVISGEGRGFCAGLDLGSFQTMADAGDPSERGREQADGTERLGPIGRTDGRITHLAQQCAYAWHEVPVPVIAAVHGVAFGGGCQIALGADIRVVSPSAKLSVMEMKWGLIPDMTGTWTLPRLVGPDVAKELVFTARVIDGEEAVRIGLATSTAADPVATALALAQEIAGKSPHAVRAAKRLIDASLSRSAAEQFAEERAEIGRLIGSPNQVEAVMAGFEERPPSYVDVDG